MYMKTIEMALLMEESSEIKDVLASEEMCVDYFCTVTNPSRKKLNKTKQSLGLWDFMRGQIHAWDL